MLCLTMRPGEYFTVGGETVILFDQLHGDRIHVSIDAPRSVAIARGAALKRHGKELPPCVADPPARKRRAYRPGAAFRWNEDRERAARALEKLAERLEQDGCVNEARVLRVQMEQIVPHLWEDELVSSGSLPVEI